MARALRLRSFPRSLRETVSLEGASMRPDVFQERPSSRVQSGRSRRRDVPSTRPAGRRRLLAVEQLEGRTLLTDVTPFAPRFSTDTNGDIAIVANTLMTVSPTNSNAAKIQAGVNNPSGVDNNGLDMVYVDHDSDPTTFDSSSAQLNLPQGATVLFAGLYWGGDLDTSSSSASKLARTQVKFSTPSSGRYSNITGTLIGQNGAGSSNPGGYHAFADVTGLVSAAGNGTYTVANVQATQGVTSSGRYAGWSLVVAYHDQTSPPRNLTVFDGYSEVDVNLPPTATTIPISGFETPPAGEGPVNAKVGIVAYEGDLGITGDTASLDNHTLSDATHPANNFFDSTISNLGVNVTSKTPNYINQLGYDSSIIQANGIIPNGATSADIELTTNGDSYFPGVVTTAIDLYAPNIKSTKSVVDMSGGSVVRPGDILDYTINVSNTGGDAAKDVILSDPIPNFTQFVPGSLQVTAGANMGPKTDAAGDDQAEYHAAGNQVIFRLGAGANATSGGVLAIGDSSTVSFEVQVDPGTPDQTVVTNQATIDYTGVSTDFPLSTLSNPADVTVVPASPSINTSQQPATTTVGTSIADKATVSGGFNPTGTVTFNLYNNSTGTGTPLFTDPDVPLVSGVATSTGYTATATGTDYWVATYNGDSNNHSVTSGTALEPVVISPASPSINTSQQPATTTVGTSIADKATVSGGFNPTGTVTFNLYNNSTGTGTPLFTDPDVPLVSGVATSTGYTATATGTDYWVATYNGDSNNHSVTSGTALEPVVISPASPSINTSQQPATTTVGTSIADKATVSGGFNPTGTVTFDLYNNSSATGTPLFTDTETLSGGTATSKGYTATATGTDYWVATYNGDSNNNSVTSGTALEPVVISPASPSINTSQQPATATVGTSIADKATVSGGFNPTGTVTFDLYNNSSATGTPLFTDTETLSGGTATSKGYTATATGTDYWVATYNGDSNNSSVTSPAGSEPVLVSPASPTITTTTSEQEDQFGVFTLKDSATLAGGFNPTGTITFTLYDPSNTVIDTEMVAVNNGNATYSTPTGAQTTQAGTYQWVASYSGDGNNNPVASNKGDEPVVVSTAVPVITTTANPSSVTLDNTGSPTLKDSASMFLVGAHPGGIITFTLYDPNNTVVDTETVAPIGGQATYSTPTGFTLPTTGTVTGTYQWVVNYSGDALNDPTSSFLGDEPVVVDPASPTITTTTSEQEDQFGVLTLKDSATLAGGFNPTGTITFTLYDPSNTVIDTEMVAVNNGNATYSTPTGAQTTQAGTYQWVASYSGDGNNNPVASNKGDEPVVV